MNCKQKMKKTSTMGGLRIFVMLVALMIKLDAVCQNGEQSVSHIMADIVLTTKTNDITPRAYEKAKMSIIDVIGISAAGFDAPAIPEIRTQYTEWGGREDATVWFTDTKLPLPMAGFVNSSAAHALDLDDYHRASNTHISVVVTPTALVVGEMVGASGQDVMEAMVVGVEVAARIGAPFRNAKKHGRFLPTSVVGGFGGVATACRLMGLNHTQTVNAFGIFYAHASGNRQALFDRTLTKRIQPAIAVQAAITAATLAGRGVTGPEDIFLSDAGLLRIYGSAEYPLPDVDAFRKTESRWEIEDLCFKKYASCGAAHPAVEAALQLTLENDLTLADVDSIELFDVWYGTGMVDVPWRDAENPQALAQFCAPYNVASVIKNRKFGPAEIDPETIASDMEVDRAARQVLIKSKEAWGAGYPGGHTVRITTKDGRVLVASFEPADLFNPDELTVQDIIDKYRSNMRYAGVLPDGEVERIISVVMALEDVDDITQLIETI
jgi:2-methylcitrate dehydratase PrpD